MPLLTSPQLRPDVQAIDAWVDTLVDEFAATAVERDRLRQSHLLKLVVPA